MTTKQKKKSFMLSPSVFSNFYLVIQECAWLAAAGMHLLPLKKHPVAKWGPQNDEAAQLRATTDAVTPPGCHAQCGLGLPPLKGKPISKNTRPAREKVKDEPDI